MSLGGITEHCLNSSVLSLLSFFGYLTPSLIIREWRIGTLLYYTYYNIHITYTVYRFINLKGWRWRGRGHPFERAQTVKEQDLR